MSKTAAWIGIWGICLGAFSASAFGATGILVSLDGEAALLEVDGDPATNETFRFEVIVDDANGMFATDSYEYLLSVSGAGLEFDYDATEAATSALAADAGHAPMYLLFGDSLGVAAADDIQDDFTTLTVSDLSDSGATYNPTDRPSLGIFVLKVIDDAAAMAGGGLHTISDGGVLLGSDEPLSIAALQIQITPEPATLALILVGGAAVILQRRRRA